VCKHPWIKSTGVSISFFLNSYQTYLVERVLKVTFLPKQKRSPKFIMIN